MVGRPKEGPAVLNWFCSPPLTSSSSFRPWPTSSLPTRKLSGLEAWERGSFAHLPVLCMLQTVLSWGHVQPFWKKRADRRFGEGWGENVAAVTAFSFSSCLEVSYRQATAGPWVFLAPSWRPCWKPFRSHVNITWTVGFWAPQQWWDPAVVEPLITQRTHN